MLPKLKVYWVLNSYAKKLSGNFPSLTLQHFSPKSKHSLVMSITTSKGKSRLPPSEQTICPFICLFLRHVLAPLLTLSLHLAQSPQWEICRLRLHTWSFPPCHPLEWDRRPVTFHLKRAFCLQGNQTGSFTGFLAKDNWTSQNWGNSSLSPLLMTLLLSCNDS